MHIKNNALIALEPASDQTGKEGCMVDASGVVMASATNIPWGVIIDGGSQGGVTTVAPCAGGFAGTLSGKLHSSPGTVNRGTRLISHSDGTFKADSGSGSRVQVAEAQESGTAGELIEIVLLSPPIALS